MLQRSKLSDRVSQILKITDEDQRKAEVEELLRDVIGSFAPQWAKEELNRLVMKPVGGAID